MFACLLKISRRKGLTNSFYRNCVFIKCWIWWNLTFPLKKSETEFDKLTFGNGEFIKCWIGWNLTFLLKKSKTEFDKLSFGKFIQCGFWSNLMFPLKIQRQDLTNSLLAMASSSNPEFDRILMFLLKIRDRIWQTYFWQVQVHQMLNLMEFDISVKKVKDRIWQTLFGKFIKCGIWWNLMFPLKKSETEFDKLTFGNGKFIKCGIWWNLTFPLKKSKTEFDKLSFGKLIKCGIWSNLMFPLKIQRQDLTNSLLAMASSSNPEFDRILMFLLKIRDRIWQTHF
jgi:hypothetical protein